MKSIICYAAKMTCPFFFIIYLFIYLFLVQFYLLFIVIQNRYKRAAKSILAVIEY